MKKQVLPWAIILLSLIISLVTYPNLPEQMAIHWSGGEVNNYAHKNLAIVLIPIIMVFSHLLITTLLKTDIFKSNNKKNSPIMNNANHIVLILLFLVHLFIIAVGLGGEFNYSYFVGILVGGVTIALANPMQKVKPNVFYGLRTPWTLKDERVWVKSNRFSAKVLVIIGFLIIILTFVVPEHITTVIVSLIIFGATISIYQSYVVYKKLNKTGDSISK